MASPTSRSAPKEADGNFFHSNFSSAAVLDRLLKAVICERFSAHNETTEFPTRLVAPKIPKDGSSILYTRSIHDALANNQTNYQRISQPNADKNKPH